MEMYSWEEIRNVGNCVDYTRDALGLPIKQVTGEWTRFDSPLRPDSDSGAFACKPECWVDHVTKEKGSILDLVARVEFDGDLFRASEKLGQYYRLSPKQVAQKARKLVKAYDYHDPETGELLHQTVRYEPKEFRQRRPDPKDSSKWIYNLKDIKPVLYRISAWQGLKWVCIVGGEKDADNLLALNVPATTNPMGEGNWKDHYNDYFKDKLVVILPDNDTPGLAHAHDVAKRLLPIAKGVKIVQLAGLQDKEDVSDWLAAGHKATELLPIIKDAPQCDEKSLEPQMELSEAKMANKRPFSNYTIGKIITNAGEPKLGPVPTHINSLVEGVEKRFHNFPRRVGGKMFDHDRSTGAIRILGSPNELISWISEKSGHTVNWNKRLEGAVSYEQLFASVHARAPRYQMISGVPNWPTRDDVYYTFGDLPKPTEDAKYFNEFCSFFETATPIDAHLLRAMVASPMYFQYKVDRPLWIIDSEHGQGVGKTKLVEMIAYLYGGEDPVCAEPFWVHYGEINSEVMMERVLRRLLSETGRQKRIFLLDNVVGYFKSSALATLVTQGSISGLAPYGKGEETRPNDLTYIITSNSATVCRDLASRSFFIMLKRPENPVKTWETVVRDYIRDYRLQIIADITGILDRGPQFTVTGKTRFRTWEREIMAPMLGSQEVYDDVLELNQDRLLAADGEVEEADQIKDYFWRQIKHLGYNPDEECIWLEARVVSKWASDCIPGFGGPTGRNARQKILNMAKGGMLNELSSPVKRWPTHKGKTGMMWGWKQYAEGGKNVKILTVDESGNAIADPFQGMVN